MCDCQKNIREEISNGYTDEGKIMTGLAFGLSTIRKGDKSIKEKVTGQQIDVTYTYVNKKGDVKLKNEKSFVSHDYCPWCGRKYE